MGTLLVAGAGGVVGSAVLERFGEHDELELVAVCRRPPEVDVARPFRHLPLDLRDADATAAALGELRDVTHVVYAAVYEKPGLIAGWSEPDHIAVNGAMLRALLEPLLAAGGLEQVTILQGTKAYGNHLHPMAIPVHERRAERGILPAPR
jgi:nucleoside-diphosphate-sugar epimerase